VSVPAPDGAATLTEVLRRIEPLGIELADIGLRRPSLDDVFLRLTGHSASAPDGSDPTDGGSTNGGSTDAGPAGLPDPERAEPASAGERP
jgi:ABC-2 type transport system ATP-binding protein